MSGGYSLKISRKGLTDRQVVNVLDWDINDVRLMTVRHKEVNWHRHMTRVDLAIDYYK